MLDRASKKLQGAPRNLDSVDPVWSRLRREAKTLLGREPALSGLVMSSILNRASLEEAIIHRVAARLGNDIVSAEMIVDIYQQAVSQSSEFGAAYRRDLMAVVDRDAACQRVLEPMLYFKGFHALQTHRLAHWLWTNERRDLALYFQSRSSEVFQTDINPAAVFGHGIFLDHATGLVVGETAVVEDDVSILQDVTLGGTGKQSGDRHPKIRRGVMIGAGAKILGNIEVGHCARIAAGSVVLQAVPHNCTVAGVPARIVGNAGCAEPARAMDQILVQAVDFSFGEAI